MVVSSAQDDDQYERKCKNEECKSQDVNEYEETTGRSEEMHEQAAVENSRSKDVNVSCGTIPVILQPIMPQELNNGIERIPVEKRQVRNENDGGGGSEKGGSTLTNGRRRPSEQSSNGVAPDVILMKNRNGSDRRITGILGIVVVIVVAGAGIVICYMYPSSPVVNLIRAWINRVKKELVTLLVNIRNTVELQTKNMGEMFYIKWLMLLKNKRLTSAARALQVQALYGVVGLMPQAKEVAMVCGEVIGSLHDQLSLMLLNLIDVLKASIESIRLVFIELTKDGGLLEQTRALLLPSLSWLTGVMKASWKVTTEKLCELFDWFGTKPESSDVILPEKDVLAPLATHQAAIQSIGEGITAQESQAVLDVQRFEKRRAAIASATNSIIEDTRAIALESIVNVKMTAVEIIEERTRQLAGQYVGAFEQALNDYKRTLWQAEEENGHEILAELTTESQAQIDVAASLVQYLSKYPKAIDEKLIEVSVVGEETFSKNELLDQSVTGYRLADSQLAAETKLSGSLASSSAFVDHSSDEDMADSKFEDESQIFTETASGGLMTAVLIETPSREHIALDKALDSEPMSEEQARVSTVEVTEVSVRDKSSFLDQVVEEGHVIDDKLHSVGKYVETDFSNPTLEPTDTGEAIAAVKHMLVTQLTTDVDDTLLKVEVLQAEASKRVVVHSSFEEETQRQQESRTEAQSKVLDGKVDMKPVEELTTFAAETFDKVEAIQPLADMRTHVAAQVGFQAKDKLEKEMVETTKYMHEDLEEGLGADDTRFSRESDQFDTESIIKIRVNADGVKGVVTEIQHTKERPVIVRSHDEAIAQKELPKGLVDVVGDTQRERTGCREAEEHASAAALTDVKMAVSDRVIAAKDIQELEQLEQILLQEEDERIRIEEELRVIAEKERIWLQTDQIHVTGEKLREDAVPGHRRIDVMKRTEPIVDVESEKRQSSLDDNLFGVSKPGLMQICLLSMSLLGLIVCLFVRHHKRGSLIHSPRRRKRWQRLADVEESEDEEVVLLPANSSDEETGTDVAGIKQPGFKVIGRMVDVEVEPIEMMSSGDEGNGKTKENNSSDTNTKVEDNGKEEEELDAERSHLIVTERAQTLMYTVDRPVASNLDALANDDDVASMSPIVSRHETTDTSQRARLRRRGIRA